VKNEKKYPWFPEEGSFPWWIIVISYFIFAVDTIVRFFWPSLCLKEIAIFLVQVLP